MDEREKGGRERANEREVGGGNWTVETVYLLRRFAKDNSGAGGGRMK